VEAIGEIYKRKNKLEICWQHRRAITEPYGSKSSLDRYILMRKKRQ
jgi:hypothetical protein